MALRFGEIVLEQGYITPGQLEEALELQRHGRAKLGRIMIYLRFLTEEQVEQVLTFQSSGHGSGKLFGDCAVELGIITPEEKEEAVRYQTTSKGVLGDLLIELGHLTEAQRDEIIRLQMESIG